MEEAEHSRESQVRRILHRIWIAFKRAWPILRFVVGLLLGGVAIYQLAGHQGELSGVFSLFENLRWWWLIPATIVEIASLVAYAGMESSLLAVGGIRAPLISLLGMTLGSQAINNSLPAGPAVGAVYGFRWFRRFGADAGFAGWAMAGTMVGASLSLALLATVGLVVAIGDGASLDLIPVLVGVLIATMALGLVFINERLLTWVLSWAQRLLKRFIRRQGGDIEDRIERIIDQVGVVDLNWKKMLAVIAWGAGSWFADCACFALAFLAVRASIPWEGLLLAYGAGQLAANLPITPGGLGAVEGSLTFALVAFGGQSVAAVDAVLVYRLISFWLILAIGWVACALMALSVRKGRWQKKVDETRAATSSAPDLLVDSSDLEENKCLIH